jgi:Helicase conserved C-terminal domain/Mitochondrial degradasome RNA helicase subunit C terminal
MRRREIFQKHLQNRVGEFDLQSLTPTVPGTNVVSWQIGSRTESRNMELTGVRDRDSKISMLQELFHTIAQAGPPVEQLLASLPDPIIVSGSQVTLFGHTENVLTWLQYVKYREAWFCLLGLQQSDLAATFRKQAPRDYYNLRIALIEELISRLPGYNYLIEKDDTAYIPKVTIVISFEKQADILGATMRIHRSQKFTIDRALTRLASYFIKDAIPQDRLSAAGIGKSLKRVARAIRNESGSELVTTKELEAFADLEIREFQHSALRLIRRKKSEQASAAIKENQRMTDYLSCWPARSGRKVRVYVGPTNSGKTFQALTHLRQSQNGMYLAPLRLLALEKHQEMQAAGIPCSLITGEEQVLASPDLSSRTIETADMTTKVSTVVIDEFQMIADGQRGWAWTNAYCGSNCSELVVTCPEHALPTLRQLANLCRDELDVVYCKRRSALKMGQRIRKLRDLPPATAIIAFSRRAVLEIKALLDDSGRRPAVLYGNLAPEIRQAEAKRFRDGETDIVVATDAIGMGLNLPVQHVVLWETHKFDGIQSRPLTAAEIQQVAGRAGRNLEAGEVHGMSPKGHDQINRALFQNVHWDNNSIPAGFTPFHLKEIRAVLGKADYHTALTFFENQLPMSFPFTPRVPNSCFLISQTLALDRLDEVLATVWLTAPVPDDEVALSWLRDWFSAFRKSTTADIPPDHGYGTEASENYIKLLDVYLWLARKFPQTFSSHEEAAALRRQTIDPVESDLRSRWKAHGLRDHECKVCGAKLLPSSEYDNCRGCYENQKEQRSHNRHNGRNRPWSDD